MDSNRLRWAGFVALVLMLAVLGWCLIPDHWTSIWMQMEFTDWVSPIANRLHGGARLYADGLHSPMPPLPSVLLRILHPQGAIWLQESELNFLFQAGTLLLLYLAFSRRVAVSLAFVATLAATPVFFALLKTILYDSMTQFLVAASAVVVARLVCPIPAAGPGGRTRWPLVILLGSLLGLLMLTKQSTGAGAAMGVCVVLLLLPSQLEFFQRCTNVVGMVVCMLLAMLVVALVISPFISIPGLIQDVFVTGSEPKGTPGHFLRTLLKFSLRISTLAVLLAVAFLAVSWIRNRRHSFHDRWQALENVFVGSVGGEVAPDSIQMRFMLAAGLTATAGFFVSYCMAGDPWVTQVPRLIELVQPIYLGGAAVVFLAAMIILRSLRGKPDKLCDHPLAPFALVFLPAALFHNLSVDYLRWTYDNNPLIVLACVFLLAPVLAEHGLGRWIGPKRGPAVCLGLLCAILFVMWCNDAYTFGIARRCVNSWPEIPHLAGAQLMPESDGMRHLVTVVQSLANPVGDDTVLLLPNDPNVEAWFDRPRPALSSAIIFSDQYWDRYVDRDFAELQAHPPKVIVVGPRKFWRYFSRHWNLNRGAERLIDLVNNQLLPAKYELRSSEPVTVMVGAGDFMDVYVRRSP